MRIADSVKAKLKNRAQSEGRTYQEILAVYGLERALYRLSISPYSNQFVLKGGILLYALYHGEFKRGTADVDLLGRGISNDLEVIKATFQQIFGLICPEDGLVFDVTTLKAERVSEFKKYPGIHISIDGFLERTQLSVSIDIGFGDVIVPSKIEMDYPTLLNHPAPRIQAYSVESVISEKFEAIVSLGKANSRMKDFYDIYALSGSFDFDGCILAEAISETFSNRQTKFDNIVAFESGFPAEPQRKRMWTSFIKAKKVTPVLDFESVVQKIRLFLTPIVNAIRENTIFDLRWNHADEVWR